MGESENKIWAVELLKYHNDKVNEHTPKKFTLVRIKNHNFKFKVNGFNKGTFVI